MRYLINKKTKEHVVCGDGAWDSLMWTVVHGDEEGWIEWSGGDECPLPRSHPFEYRTINSSNEWPVSHKPQKHMWSAIRVYRPILDDQAAPVPSVDDILSRLEAAHAAAAQIPDILDELRERLGRWGYWVGTTDVFDKPEDAVTPETDPVGDPDDPEEDMTDWRNWREGDLIECLRDWAGQFTKGKIYEVRQVYRTTHPRVAVMVDDWGNKHNGWGAANFRFHCRAGGGA